MTYTAAEGRQELLEAVAEAIEHLAFALACLGDAYEALDDHSADRLEAELFAPVQSAYGRAQRTYAAFADRHGVPRREFAPASAGSPTQGAQSFIANAVGATAQASRVIAELQDSMLPNEVGDAELREGLVAVRARIDDLPARARELVRVLGR